MNVAPEQTAPPVDPAPASAHDHHFRTDHLMADLKGRSVRGGAVTMAAQGAKFVLQLGSTAVLARLLTPADFGLVAMVTAVTGFVAMFKDAGLSMATVQREHVTHEQVSTLFWINVALSAALMLITAALSPAIAWFYGEPRLTAITLAFAATFILGGFTVQHQALLQRQMRFTALSAIAVASFAASVAAGIVAAWYGLGYWALVIMGAAGAAVNAALVWMLSGWRPGRPVRGSGVMPMLKFGGNLTGFSFVNYFSRNADNVLIGWWWGAGALGIYTKAYSLLMTPLHQINAPLTSVALPALSRLALDPERYQRYYVRVLTLLLVVTTPAVIFLIVTSDLIILIVLGEQWLRASRIFAWLGVVGLLQPLSSTTGWLFISQGRTQEMLRWGCFSSLFTIGVFVLSIPMGTEVLAAAYALSGVFVRTPVLLWYVTRSGPVRLSHLGKALLPSAVAGIILVTGVTVVNYICSTWSPIPRMSLLIPVFVLCYFIGLMSMRSIRRECINIIQALWPRKKMEAS